MLAAKRRNEEFVNEKAAEAEAPKAVEATYDLNDDDDDLITVNTLPPIR